MNKPRLRFHAIAVYFFQTKTTFIYHHVADMENARGAKIDRTDPNVDAGTNPI